MLKFKSRFSRLALAAGLVVAGISTAALASHSWGGYHWARTTPQFTLKLGDNMTSADWKAHLAQTSSDCPCGCGQRFDCRGNRSTPLACRAACGYISG